MRKLPIIAILGIATCMASCTSKSTPSQPPAPNHNESQSGPAWKTTLVSNCSDGTPDDSCVAHYGFTATADGKYEIGPGPKNEASNGMIEPEDFKPLQSAVNSLMMPGHMDSMSAESCTPNDHPSTEDAVTLVKEGQTEQIIKTSSDQVCVKASLTDAQALYQAMSTLAQKYYNVPFPNSCQDTAAAVTAMYNAVQTCTTDADCTYVDENYAEITPNSGQFVPTDTCTVVKPLVVGNRALIAKSLKELQDALQHAQATCDQGSSSFTRSDCTGLTGFESSKPPVCSQGVCKANPAASN